MHLWTRLLSEESTQSGGIVVRKEFVESSKLDHVTMLKNRIK